MLSLSGSIRRSESEKGATPCKNQQKKHAPCQSNGNKLIGREALHTGLNLVQVEGFVKDANGQFAITFINHT
jgi:hypothetical protein